MNKYDNIEILDVNYFDDAIDRFVADTNKEYDEGYTSVAMVGNKELIAWALDEVVDLDCVPVINEVMFGADDELHIIYITKDYELYVCPLNKFDYIDYVRRIYIDGNEKIKQAMIDKLLDNESQVTLFFATEEESCEAEGTDVADEKECEKCTCPECKAKRDLSNADKTDKTEYRVNGRSVSKAEFDKAKGKYDEELKDILKKHCEFMDSFNNLFARVW